MIDATAIIAVESRALAARITVTELCAVAQVHQSSWSRAKTRGRIRPKLLRKMEDAMALIEQERAKTAAAA